MNDKQTALEQRKQAIRQILEEAKDWESERLLGPLNVYSPGDVTNEYVKTIAEWVEPKNDDVASALLSAGKCIPAALAIMVGTPAALAEDAAISVFNSIRQLIGLAPSGAYLPPELETLLIKELDMLEREIADLEGPIFQEIPPWEPLPECKSPIQQETRSSGHDLRVGDAGNDIDHDVQDDLDDESSIPFMQ